MPRVGNVLEAAPAIRNLLVLRERIGNQRKWPQILLEGFGERLGSRLAFLAIGVLQEIERWLDRHRLSRELETQNRDGFVEKPIPGGIAGHRFLVEEFLESILELVWLFLANILDPGTIVVERGVDHRGFELRVVDTVELKSEKQEMKRRSRDAFLHVTIELRAKLDGSVAGIDQRGIRNEAAKPVVNPLIPLDRPSERMPPTGAFEQCRQSSFEFLFECCAVAVGLFQVALDLGAVQPRIKIFQI